MCSVVRNDQMRLIELLMFVWVRGAIDVESKRGVSSQNQGVAPIQQRQASRPFSSPQRDDRYMSSSAQLPNTNHVRFRSLVSTNVRKKYLGFLSTMSKTKPTSGG
jgi:hypothetical protein